MLTNNDPVGYFSKEGTEIIQDSTWKFRNRAVYNAIVKWLGGEFERVDRFRGWSNCRLC